jgi:LytS/YehU family sensor histidine kinase
LVGAELCRHDLLELLKAQSFALVHVRRQERLSGVAHVLSKSSKCIEMLLVVLLQNPVDTAFPLPQHAVAMLGPMLVVAHAGHAVAMLGPMLVVHHADLHQLLQQHGGLWCAQSSDERERPWLASSGSMFLWLAS